jgi:hypothetical protein
VAKHILLRTPGGEEVLVLSMAGHEDCKVLERGVTPARVPGCKRVKGRWKVDRREFNRIRKVQRGPIIQELEDEIAELTKRLAQLEKATNADRNR